ncbi:MAG: hypothetical protein GWN56_02630 [Nitrosopumilaceae archaeon]|nr:IS110 family transposase [Nitrosopumilaceae archaeon]NIU86217.1 hypothetical protein [Nitrosopumilaceae archaeon]
MESKKVQVDALSDNQEIMDGLVIDRLNKDIKDAVKDITKPEVRYLVKLYYAVQKNRIKISNQLSRYSQNQKPCRYFNWQLKQFEKVERQIRAAMDVYSKCSNLGIWMRSICGVGPVTASGFLSHIDWTRVHHAGSIWIYGGLDPSVKWEKGKKRPYNADFKTLCWKQCDVFQKYKNKDTDFYGGFIEKRKKYEQAKNLRGDYKDQAYKVLNNLQAYNRSFSDENMKKLKAGQLTDGIIQLRAFRWTAKLFISHIYDVYHIVQGKEPPIPYVLVYDPENQGHTVKDYIKPPNLELAKQLALESQEPKPKPKKKKLNIIKK